MAGPHIHPCPTGQPLSHLPQHEVLQEHHIPTGTAPSFLLILLLLLHWPPGIQTGAPTSLGEVATGSRGAGGWAAVLVQAPVELEVDALGETAAALVALEGLLARVQPQVGLQVAPAAEALGARLRGREDGCCTPV